VAEVSARANQLLGSAMGCLDDSQPENRSPLSRMLVPVDESKILDVKWIFDTQLVSSQKSRLSL
jgi:hypothetical protein